MRNRNIIVNIVDELKLFSLFLKINLKHPNYFVDSLDAIKHFKIPALNPDFYENHELNLSLIPSSLLKQKKTEVLVLLIG